MSHSACLYLSPLSFITPVVKRGPEVSSSAAAAHRAGPAQQPCTPLNQTLCAQTPQVYVHALLLVLSYTLKKNQQHTLEFFVAVLFCLFLIKDFRCVWGKALDSINIFFPSLTKQ